MRYWLPYNPLAAYLYVADLGSVFKKWKGPVKTIHNLTKELLPKFLQGLELGLAQDSYILERFLI